jgi:sarcosine oxidase, subunit beta
MKTNIDVVVIGGGLMGCTISFQLASRGLNVAVVERNQRPGMETTARSGAIIRAHYGVPELVSLAHEANKRYLTFSEEVGYDCGFVKSGYVVLVDDDDIQALRSNVAMHRDYGVDVSLLTADQLQQLVPTLNVDDCALAAYEPNGGYARPSMTVDAYSRRAQDLGASFIFNTSVVSAKLQSQGWSIALSDGDELSCRDVVIATGNWSTPVGAMFDLDLPVSPVRAQIVVVERPGGSVPMPVVSDLINLAYFREESDDGMWVGSSDMADLQEKLAAPEGFNEVADEIPIRNALSKTFQRFHDVDAKYAGSVKRSFTGLYETTPDWQPIIDCLPGNIHVAVGFSGHGFKLAPVIGDIVADNVCGSKARYDTSIFDLNRFAESRPIKSRFIYQRARFLR